MQFLFRIGFPLLLVGDGLAAPETSQGRLVESPLSSANLIETGLGLAFVLAVMLSIAWLVKRYVQVPGIGKGQVQILGGVSLGAREKAVLLVVDGKRLLVGVAPGRVQTLIELGDAGERPEGFAEQLEAVKTDISEKHA